MTRPLTELECEIVRQVHYDWRSFRTILWEVNGPRETTLQTPNVQHVLDRLCKLKIIERKRGKSTARHNMYSLPGEHVHYRRRAA